VRPPLGSKCQSNLRQLGIALHNYHGTRGCFPHSNYNYLDSTFFTPPPYNNMQDRAAGSTTHCPISNRTSSIGFSIPTCRPTPARSASPNSMHLSDHDVARPTRPARTAHVLGGLSGQPTQGFSGNYVVCAGDGYFNEGGVTNSANLDGIFYALSRTRLTDITDGTSNTAMSSEIILSPDVVDHDIRGRYFNPAHGGVLFSTRIPPNTLVPDQFDWCSSQPVRRAPCIWTGVNMFLSARSYHTGGVNLGLADGSVRFINDSVDVTAYKALGSRNGGEVATIY